MSINRVFLIGNVGKDPEIKNLSDTKSVANFPMATTEHYTNKEGVKISNTEWHNIVAWRGLAKVCQDYVRKGDQIYIEGQIKTRSYDDTSGVKHYVTEIFAEQIQLLGKKPPTPPAS